MPEDLTCQHCGKVAADELELDVYHRGCRLSAMYPEARKELGGGLVSFDVAKIMEKLEGQVMTSHNRELLICVDPPPRPPPRRPPRQWTERELEEAWARHCFRSWMCWVESHSGITMDYDRERHGFMTKLRAEAK